MEESAEIRKQDAQAINTALRNAFGMSQIAAWRIALSKKACMGESLDAPGEQMR